MLQIRLIKAEGLRRLLVCAFFIAYTVTFVYFLKYATDINDMILYFFLLLFVPFGILYEIIRYRYSKALELLNNDCDPESALAGIQFVKRADFLQRYRAQIAYIECFVLLDTDRAGDALAFIHTQISKVIIGNKRSNFEYNYLLFSAFVSLGDKVQAETYLTNIRKICNTQSRPGNDIDSLNNSIEGIFEAVFGDASLAMDYFEKIELDKITPREQARTFYYRSISESLAGDHTGARRDFDKAIAIAPKINFFKNHQSHLTHQ